MNNVTDVTERLGRPWWQGTIVPEGYAIVETLERADTKPFGPHIFRFMAVRQRERMHQLRDERGLPSYHLRVTKIGRRWWLVVYQNRLISVRPEE